LSAGEGEGLHVTETLRFCAMADHRARRNSVVLEPTRSRTAIAGGATRLDLCSCALRAMPCHRQGEREPARDCATVSHVASQVPDRRFGEAVGRRDHCRPSHYAAIPAGTWSGRGRHRLPENARALNAMAYFAAASTVAK